jgi:hypothetical protein
MWMQRISGDYVPLEKVSWLQNWMRIARPGDVVYLDSNSHERCHLNEADVIAYV